MSLRSVSVVTPRSSLIMFVVSKDVSTPPLRVLITRLAAGVDWSTVPASQTRLPIDPLALMLNFRRCPSQKGSALMGWKDAS